MKKEWLETVLEVASLPHKTPVVDTEALFELHREGNVSTTETRKMSEPPRLEGVVIGTLIGLNNAGEPFVDFPANPAGAYMLARSAVAVGKTEIGREVALLFQGGDVCKPIIMGLIQAPEEVQVTSPESTSIKQSDPLEVDIDGERLVLTAKKEIVLRCGKASITLTQAGKILIRGAYLLSRSSGVNRIKGGSVQIN